MAVRDGAAVLGNFSFQKMAMVRDLVERGAELAAYDLVAALAGDAGARTRLLAERCDVVRLRLTLIHSRRPGL